MFRWENKKSWEPKNKARLDYVSQVKIMLTCEDMKQQHIKNRVTLLSLTLFPSDASFNLASAGTEKQMHTHSHKHRHTHTRMPRVNLS